MWVFTETSPGGPRAVLAGALPSSGADEKVLTQTSVPRLVSRTCCSLWDQVPFLIVGKILMAAGLPMYWCWAASHQKQAWGPVTGRSNASTQWGNEHPSEISSQKNLKQTHKRTQNCILIYYLLKASIIIHSDVSKNTGVKYYSHLSYIIKQ